MGRTDCGAQPADQRGGRGVGRAKKVVQLMSEEQHRGTSRRLTGEPPADESTAEEEIDIAELTAAVERLLRRDLEIERERLRAGQRRWRA